MSDYSNCSRTMLFDINELKWDKILCEKLGIPMSMLPTPVPSSMIYGKVAPGITGLEMLAGVPVCGSAGDQAAALIGQGLHRKGAGEEHLRNRLLYSPQHRRSVRSQRKRPCYERCVVDRANHLRA